MRRKHNYTPYGLWVTNCLAERNMTQQDLVRITGIKKSVISDVLIGRNNREEHKAKISAVLQKEV